MGIPEPVWVGICALSKSGTSPYRFGDQQLRLNVMVVEQCHDNIEHIQPQFLLSPDRVIGVAFVGSGSLLGGGEDGTSMMTSKRMAPIIATMRHLAK